jgi:hypothetical protein
MVRKYPTQVRKFLKLAMERERRKKRFDDSGDMKEYAAIKKINRRIRKLMLPVTREWLRREIACVRKAKTGMDLEGCGMQTFYCLNGLMGCEISIAECPPDTDDPGCVAQRKRRAKRLTEQDREEASGPFATRSGAAGASIPRTVSRRGKLFRM